MQSPNWRQLSNRQRPSSPSNNAEPSAILSQPLCDMEDQTASARADEAVVSAPTGTDLRRYLRWFDFDLSERFWKDEHDRLQKLVLAIKLDVLLDFAVRPRILGIGLRCAVLLLERGRCSSRWRVVVEESRTLSVPVNTWCRRAIGRHPVVGRRSADVLNRARIKVVTRRARCSSAAACCSALVARYRSRRFDVGCYLRRRPCVLCFMHNLRRNGTATGRDTDAALAHLGRQYSRSPSRDIPRRGRTADASRRRLWRARSRRRRWGSDPGRRVSRAA